MNIEIPKGEVRNEMLNQDWYSSRKNVPHSMSVGAQRIVRKNWDWIFFLLRHNLRGETRRRRRRRRRTALDKPGGFGRESKIGRNHETMNKTFKV